MVFTRIYAKWAHWSKPTEGYELEFVRRCRAENGRLNRLGSPEVLQIEMATTQSICRRSAHPSLKHWIGQGNRATRRKARSREYLTFKPRGLGRGLLSWDYQHRGQPTQLN